MSRAIYWFRNNYRLTDNPSLRRACSENDELLYVLIWDKRWDQMHPLGFPVMGNAQRVLRIDAIQSLAADLNAIGVELIVRIGESESVLRELCERHAIKRIYASKEPGFYEQEQEASLAADTDLILEDDNSLIPEPDRPFALPDLPNTFTTYRKMVETKLHIRAIESIDFFPSSILDRCEVLAIPSIHLDDRRLIDYRGGSQAAKHRIDHYFEETQSLSRYKITRNGMTERDQSSKLSPFLAVGSISPVQIYHRIKQFEKRHGANESTYWLFFELLWRDFFRLVSWKHGRFLFLLEGIQHRHPNVRADQKEFERWINGVTGNDFIDANMRELKHTGFMSNRGRQNVASFLVHELNLPWTWGAAWFESMLIDFDVSSNWGNWMYLAGVGNDPRSRVFNIEKQAEQYDPDRVYRDRWTAT